MVTDRRLIVLGYLKTWFLIDLVAVLPIQFVTSNTLSLFGKMARVPRVYKLLKTAKFLRHTKFLKNRSHIRKQIAAFTDTKTIEGERLFKFSLLFLILCHTLSCLWYMVAKLQDFSE